MTKTKTFTAICGPFVGVYVQKQFRDAVYIDTNVHE